MASLDFSCLMLALQPAIDALDAVAAASGEAVEGNVLYMHQSSNLASKNIPKQRNLIALGAAMPSEDARAIEIGFNAGHSSLLLLASHPTLNLVAFDLCEHSYTQQCAQLLRGWFTDRFELIVGRCARVAVLQHSLRRAAVPTGRFHNGSSLIVGPA